METKGEALIELNKRDQQIPDEVINNFVSKANIKRMEAKEKLIPFIIEFILSFLNLIPFPFVFTELILRKIYFNTWELWLGLEIIAYLYLIYVFIAFSNFHEKMDDHPFLLTFPFGLGLLIIIGLGVLVIGDIASYFQDKENINNMEKDIKFILLIKIIFYFINMGIDTFIAIILFAKYGKDCGDND